MKKLFSLILSLCLLMSCCAAAYAADGEFSATAKGFGGDVTVTLTIANDQITAVTAEGPMETEGIGSKALEELPGRMVEQNSVDVDVYTSATFTSNAILEAAKAALEAAGLKPEDLEKKEAAAADIVVPTFDDPDVIIVGAGSTGVNAAIAAADAGATVYLIEKNDDVGGSIRFAGGTTSAACAQMQKDAGLEDSPENFAEDLIRMGGGYNIPELSIKHTQRAAAAVDWLDSLGADFGDRIPKMSASYDPFNVEREYRVTGGGKAIIGVIRPELDRVIAEGKVCLMLNTEVRDLIYEDGTAKGVILTDGREFRCRALVLTPGGYCHSEEMLHKYNYENVLTMAPSFVTGDGYFWAEKLNAKFNNMDYMPAYPGGVPVGSFDCTVTAVVKDYPGVIWVDTNGQRIVNEFNALDSERKAAYAAAPHQLVYMILTQGIRDTQSSIISRDENWEKFDALLAEENSVYKADTLDELAAKLGIDAEGLKATVDTWNADTEKGEDSAFGRPAESMMKLEGPFYAVKTCPYVMLSKGGPLMNAEAQMLDVNGNVIPGVYEGGEFAGGANIGGHANIGGLANTSTIVWGKIAGENAAAYALAQK